MPEKFDNKKEFPSYLNNPNKNDRAAKGLSPNKTFFIIFTICLAAIILGFLHLNNVIKSPFAIPSSSKNTNLNLLNDDQMADLSALQVKDTDSDGLSDYDELYKYNTSPYLKDSDSDGISDKDEINNGTDPNCPEGKDCTGQTASANQNTNIATESNTNTAYTNTNSALLSGNLTVTELRETLKNAGVSQDVLNNTDDATLMQMYQETLQTDLTNLNTNSGVTNLNTNQSAVNQNTNASLLSNVNASTLTTDDLKNFTASEIRELLKSTGVADDTLNSLDDDTLKAIFLQAINETSTQ